MSELFPNMQINRLSIKNSLVTQSYITGYADFSDLELVLSGFIAF